MLISWFILKDTPAPKCVKKLQKKFRRSEAAKFSEMVAPPLRKYNDFVTYLHFSSFSSIEVVKLDKSSPSIEKSEVHGARTPNKKSRFELKKKTLKYQNTSGKILLIFPAKNVKN